MDDNERDVMREFQQLKRKCRIAPGPKGGQFPEWTQDGVESLPDFFNGTAHVWDAIFEDTYQFLHKATTQQIPETDEPIRILDVGCGTGLELAYIFERAPNARITGLDQAPRMLSELSQKYRDRMGQITLVEASCLEWPAGLSDFDFALSILTMHHFPPDTKRAVYANINRR